VDEENSEIVLAGAVFNLFKKNIKSKEYEKVITNLETNKDGNLIINSLNSGDYMLVETKAPYGYIVDKDKKYFRLGYSNDNKIIDHGIIVITKRKLLTTNLSCCYKYPCCYTTTRAKQTDCDCDKLKYRKRAKSKLAYQYNTQSMDNVTCYKYYKLCIHCTCQSRCYYKNYKAIHKLTCYKHSKCVYCQKYKHENIDKSNLKYRSLDKNSFTLSS
jgi:hypothetical protein